MKATIEHVNGVSVIRFEGFLDFEHSSAIKEKLLEVVQGKKNKKILFNFEKLEFVGSSGIKPFVQFLKKLNKSQIPPKYYGLSPEYQKIFRSLEGRSKFDILGPEGKATQSYRIYNRNFIKGGRA